MGWENLAYLYGASVAGQPPAAGQTGNTTGSATGTTTTGQTSGLTTQSGTAPIALQTLFPYGSSNTNVGVNVEAARTTTVAISGGYSLSGNLSNTTLATEVYPEQFGPFGRVSVSHRVSPVNTFVTIASAQNTRTPMGVCVPAPPPDRSDSATRSLRFYSWRRQGAMPYPARKT